MDIQELYQELIIDHGTEPRNCHPLNAVTHHAKGVNPLCGDKLEIFILLKDGKVSDISFLGQGCAISMASASIMTETLKGKTIAEVQDYFQRFVGMVTSDADELEDNQLGKLQALAGVRAYPSRVKCATLAWHAMDAALNKNEEITTE